MSIKTTHSVTRQFAILAIQKKMMEKLMQLEELTDAELEDLLTDIIHNGFYNFSIDDEEYVNEQKRVGNPYLDDVENLPEENDAW